MTAFPVVLCCFCERKNFCVCVQACVKVSGCMWTRRTQVRLFFVLSCATSSTEFSLQTPSSLTRLSGWWFISTVRRFGKRCWWLFILSAIKSPRVWMTSQTQLTVKRLPRTHSYCDESPYSFSFFHSLSSQHVKTKWQSFMLSSLYDDDVRDVCWRLQGEE